jgi:hypothetical protein
MFELRANGHERDDELVLEARAARDAGFVSFQVFVQHGRGRSPESSGDEFETAHLVDLLEREGWSLENVAHAAEPVNPWAYGVTTTKTVGTIYTFRITTASYRANHRAG